MLYYMTSYCERNSLDSLVNLRSLLYENGTIKSPLTGKENKIIFADDTATGRPCHVIDKLIEKQVYPYYSNTHSNATCGRMMSEMIQKCRNIIHKKMNVDNTKKIIFTGNGTTGAINHLVNKINFSKYDKVMLYFTPFEHHSNFLPWREIAKNKKNISINIFDYNNNLEIDVNPLYKMLADCIKNKNLNMLILISMTGCSNVTGKRYDKQIKCIWKEIASFKKHLSVYLLVDYACSAPYINIDGSKCDGFFFSGHKFLGGQQTPGCLVVNKDLFQTECPYNPGGGCVVRGDDKVIMYKDDIETRESGGTPNIVGIIRLLYVLQLSESIMNNIIKNESIITSYCTQRMKLLMLQYKTLNVLFIQNRDQHYLPIYPVSISGLHYNMITVLFNDLFGIQTRGGISCCGILGRICSESYNIDGWCRITFSYLMNKFEIESVFKILEHIITNGEKYVPYYLHDKDMNIFMCIK